MKTKTKWKQKECEQIIYDNADEPVQSIYLSMGYCKKDITPLLTHWS